MKLMGGGITGINLEEPTHTNRASSPHSRGEHTAGPGAVDSRPQLGPLTYLACPYSHPDRAVRVARFEAANRAAGSLMAKGHKVFSPISHTHPIAEVCSLPLGWDYWQEFDRAYLAHTGLVVVLRIDGWRESTGVTAEIAIANEMQIPVEYMAADDASPAVPDVMR